MNDQAKINAELNEEISLLKQRIQELEQFESEHKQAEEALRESEEKYRLVVENAAESIVVAQDGLLKYVNPMTVTLLGYSKEMLTSMPFVELVHPEDMEKLFEAHIRTMQGEVVTQPVHQFRVVTMDGTVRWADSRAVVISWEGKPATLNFLTDITEHKRAEEALRESEKRYRELSIIDDLSRLYNSRHFYLQLKIELDRSNRYDQPLTLLMLDLDDFKAFNDAYGHVEGDLVLLRFGQVVKGCLRQTDSAYRYGGEEFTILLPMTTSADGAVTAERIRTEFKKETFSPAPGQDVHVTVSIGLAQYKPQEDMKAFVHRVDQLMYQGKKNGKDRVCCQPSPFITTEEHQMNEQAMKNQKLIEEISILKQRNVELEQSEADRERAEEALRTKDMQLRTILESTGDGILAVDNAGSVIKTNQRFVNLWNVPSELLERGNDEALLTFIVGQLVDPDAFLERIHFLYQSTTEDFDTILFRDGRIVEGYSYPLLNEGVINGRVWSFRDITDHKQAEKALKDSESKYQFLAESMANVVFMLDINLMTTYVSPSIERMLGYTPEERIAQKVDQQLTLQSQQLVFNTLVAELDREKMKDADPDRSQTLELEYYHKDGSIKHLATYIRGIRDNDGNLTGFYGSHHDITDRKKAEEDLRKSLGQLRRAVQTTIQVLGLVSETKDPYTAGHQKRTTDLARAMATELGLPPEQIEGIRMAGVIHDIGKISLPTEILTKPTKLLAVEFNLIKEHARKGYEILKDVESPWSLAEMVYQHHERINGSGYPRGLKGDEILIEARILAVADVVESMASYRPYRAALGIDAALEEIGKNRGVLYDPSVVDACLRLFREKGYRLTEV